MWPVLLAALVGVSPTVTDPLVPVPEGCEAPPAAHVVFVGTVTDSDFRSVRFEIDQVRAGNPSPFAFDIDRIDVRYGLDAQFLDVGATYLVSAVVHPDLGLLTSRVTDPIEHFGGDEVIGVSETDVDCPDFEDPVRTLHVDGTPIDADIVQPFLDARLGLATALFAPLAVAAAAIFVIAMFRLSLSALFRSLVRPQQR